MYKDFSKDEKPVAPNAEPLFSNPVRAPMQDDQPIEYLPSAQPAAQPRSWLALLCALCFLVAVSGFFFKQWNTYFPQAQEALKTSYYKLVHKNGKVELGPDIKPVDQRVPLAKIQVMAAPVAISTAAPPAVAPTPVSAVASVPRPLPVVEPVPPPAPAASAPASIPIITPSPGTSATLNIHGVMANGSTNAVLIDDQVYQEGDEVDGVKIVKISMDYLTVINNGKEEKIPVNN